MNKNKTLIAYATKSGVTEESANAISEVLKNKYKFEVDLLNLMKTPSPDITSYKNIFIGSGIRMGKWYKQALRFLNGNFDGKNVFIFISSCKAGDPKDYEDAIKQYIENVLVEYPHVKPVEVKASGGRMKIFGKTITDNYDVEKVKSWADEIGKKLKEKSQ
jgi:menaquinone-dependent protoporphyrinogen oxidase